MEKETVVFHSVDRKILESYKSVIEGMAEYMGTAYEFVLHSLEDYDHSVIAIINGQHTGRSVGAPITNLALEMLGKIEHSEHSDHISYFTKNKDGAPLKSTTIAIRGHGNRIIGLICINLYLNTEFDVVIRNFLPANTQEDQLVEHESFEVDSQTLLVQSFQEAQTAVESNPEIPYVNRNKEIIRILYNKRIFDLKDAVSYVAQKLAISKNTVYMHIRNCRNT